MALLFLALLYVLFTMGLRENLKDVGTPSSKATVVADAVVDCSIDGRVVAMITAWNDTIQSPQKIDMDTNVYFTLWSSNVIRRGLDKVYTDPVLFTKMMELSKNGELDPSTLRELMEPYYQKETPLPSPIMPLTPFCFKP